MQQLPWRLITVPADGRCALHATAVACGYTDANKIKSDLLQYYRGTQASMMIDDLFNSGSFMTDTHIKGFGDSNVANPLYFKDFICEKSPWIKTVIACQCENREELNVSKRQTSPHNTIVSFIHKYIRHQSTVNSVLRRDAVIFLNYASHWYVLLPYERSLGL